MKTIEEKAKAYDESLERAKEQLNGAKVFDYDNEQIAHDIRTTVYEIFPELKESEDEKIRKEIIKFLDGGYTQRWIADETKESWVAWLEKQGEQNPADKVEPKFKKGEWITNEEYVWQIDEVKKENYLLIDSEDTLFAEEIAKIDSEFHLWTIQDAKDGDVLAAHECIVLFKEIDGLNIRCYCTYHFMNNPSFHVETLHNKDAFHPATKEQRDQLGKVMVAAGYVFDKKELKKIEQKSAWSEEDEKRVESLHGWLDTLVNYIHHDAIVSLDLRRERMQQVERLKTWLKSLKERYTWKPSEEQMEALDYVIENEKDIPLATYSALCTLYNDLKKIKVI